MNDLENYHSQQQIKELKGVLLRLQLSGHIVANSGNLPRTTKSFIFSYI